MIAMKRSIFLISILDDRCLTRPSEPSSAFVGSWRGGAVTGSVGSALDQNGSKARRNLWRSGPYMKQNYQSHGNCKSKISDKRGKKDMFIISTTSSWVLFLIPVFIVCIIKSLRVLSVHSEYTFPCSSNMLYTTSIDG